MESKIIELKELTKSLSMRDRELYLFKHFMEILPIGVYVLDANRKVYYFNRKAIEILGRGIDPNHPPEQTADIYGVYIEGTDEEYPFEKYPICLSLQGLPASADDIEIRKPDGKSYNISARAAPIFDTNGNVEYALSTFYIINEEDKKCL